MTNVQDLFTDPCQKIDPWCVDAFFDLKLTPSDSAELTLDNSWAPTSLDLTPAIKAGETITNLLITDTALQYNREDYGRNGAENGGVDCISGDDLSRIISMKYLKDVSQTTPTDGDVYMFDSTTNMFVPFNLKSWMAQVDGTLATHTQQITELQEGIDNLNQTLQQNFATVNNRLDAIEQTVAKPNYVPASAVLAWGTTNTAKNSAPSTQGIWTHNPANNVLGDTRFD